MGRDGTDGDAEADHTAMREDAISRALVPSGQDRDATSPPRLSRAGGRPMADFLAQLIVDTDPRVRVSRTERTREAASLYQRAALRGRRG